jgi:DNA mismatch repair protein MSH5
MQVQVDTGADEPGEKITYLYTLKPGRSGSSFGGWCAAMNGIDPAIVQRAEVIIRLLSRNENLRLACATLSADEAKETETAETVARKFVSTEYEEGGAERGHCGASVRELVQAVLQTQ